MSNPMNLTSYVRKPGPNAGAGWTLSVPSQGGGQPVQIMSLVSAGTSGATATVRVLDSSGFLTGSQFGGVYIIPYPEFAEVSDRGLMSTHTPTSGIGNADIRYVQISKQAFMTF